MKTLSIVNVVESTILENTATVYFHKDGMLCHVDVTEIPSVGTVMSKYFGTEVQVKSVARNDRGRFVSIKGYEDQLIQVGLNSGWIVKQEVEVDLSIFQVIKEETVVIEESKALDMSFGTTEKPKAITRVRGGTHLVVPTPIVEQPKVEEVVQFTTESMDDCIDQMHDDEYYNNMIPDNIIYLDPDHSHYEQHNTNTKTDDMDVSVQGIVKSASRIVYNYFNQEMYLKTINFDQLLKQFSIIWNNNVQLHSHKEEMRFYIFDCIKYYYNEVIGRRKFMMKHEFMQVITKALRKAVELSLAA